MLYWTLIFLIACLGLMEASFLLWLVPAVGRHGRCHCPAECAGGNANELLFWLLLELVATGRSARGHSGPLGERLPLTRCPADL